MKSCQECGSTKNVDEHHTSYDPESTVPLCRSCHQQVHGDESHELHPDDSAEKTTIEITNEQKAALDEIKASQWEPYHEAMSRLIEAYDDAHSDPVTESGEAATVEDLHAVRDEIIGTLAIDDYANEEHVGELADMIKEATDAAQNANQKLEGLQR